MDSEPGWIDGTDVPYIAAREVGFGYPQSPWVFPADSKAGHIAEPKEQRQVKGKKIRHLPGPHVLRHTYVTVALSLGFPEHEVGILVNHRLPKGSMTQRYVGRHVMFMARLREVQEAVSAALMQAIDRAGNNQNH